MPLRIGVGRRLGRDTPLTSPYTDLQRGGTCCGGRRRCGMSGAVPLLSCIALTSTLPMIRSSARRVRGEVNNDFRQIPAADDAHSGRSVPAASTRLTKPLGALGRLESLAAQVCAVQSTLHPTIAHAGRDRLRRRSRRRRSRRQRLSARGHRADGEELSCRRRRHQRARASSGLDLWIVDAGVDGECGQHPRLIGAKIRRGTRDLTVEAAMTAGGMSRRRSSRGRTGHRSGDRPPAATPSLLGRDGHRQYRGGGALDARPDRLFRWRIASVAARGSMIGAWSESGRCSRRPVERRAPPQDPIELLAEFGGYEIAMLTGAIGRRRASHVDHRGRLHGDGRRGAGRAHRSRVLDYCVFGHCSAEHAHRALLAHLECPSLCSTSACASGEGSGAAVALSVVRAAVALFTRWRPSKALVSARRALIRILLAAREAAQLVLFLRRHAILDAVADARVARTFDRELVAAIGALLSAGGRAGRGSSMSGSGGC